MAGGSLGSLVVEISANVAKWSADMTQVAAAGERTAKRIDDAFSVTKKAIADLVAVVATVETFDILKEKIEGAIEAAAGLERMSQQTGAAVQGLADLTLVAKLSGTGTEELTKGLQKLSKAMIDAENGNTKTVAAFNAIGLSIKDLASLKPDEVFKLIGQRMAEFGDGASKVAVAQQLLGKAGAQLLPVLKDLAENGDLHSKITEEEAKKAEELEKNIARLKITMGETRDEMIRQLIPAFNELTENMLAAQKAGAGFLQTLISIPASNIFAAITDTPIQERIDADRDAVKRLKAEIDNPSIKTPEFLAQLQRNYTAANAALQGLLAQQRAAALAGAGDVSGLTDQVTRGQTATVKPQIKFDYKDTAAADKAARDEILKDTQRWIASEDAAYSRYFAALQHYYSEGELDAQSYFAARRAGIESNLATVTGGYDREIAAAQKYANSLKVTGDVVKDSVARTEALGKVRELQETRTKAATAATEQLLQVTEQEETFTRRQSESIEQLNIALLKMQGRLEEAAAAQAKLSLEQLPRKQLGPQGDELARAEIDQKRVEELIAAKQKAIAQIETREGVLEGNIAVLEQTGAITSLEALRQVGSARQAEISQLEILIAEQDKLAQATKNPDAILAVEQLRLKLEQLKATADPLADKFRGMFQTAFADQFAKAIDGTESLSKAFRDMTSQIFADLSRIASQDIASAIFGKSGPGQGGGGLFSAISSLIGGGSGLSPGQAGPPANLAGSSGGFASLLASVGSLFQFASGTDYVPRDMLAMIHQGERVVPASQNYPGGYGHTTIHVHMPAGTNVSRESMSATGAAVARALSVNSRRNN